MHLKLVLVGLAGLIFGLLGFWVDLDRTIKCGLMASPNFQWTITWNVSCDFENYPFGTFVIFLIIGTVLLIAGIKKKSKSEDKPNLESNS